MNKSLSKIGVVTSICMSLSCTSSNNKPVIIDFSADSSAIILSDIHPVGLLQLKNSKASATTRMNWVSVTVNGAGVPGKVNIQDNKLLFIPEKPFEKGKNYVVSTPLNSNFGGAKEILKGKINYKIKPQQKTLQR